MVKLAYVYHVDVETLLVLRMGFSAPLFLALGIWSLGRESAPALSGRDIRLLVILGVLGGYLPMWLNFAGLSYVSAGLERVILFLYPTMVVLISAMLYQHKITWVEVFSLLTSYAGVSLAVGHDLTVMKSGAGDTVLGALLVAASALTYAGYLVFSGRLIPRMGSATFTSAIMLVVGIAAAVHFSLTSHHTALLHLPPQVYGLSLLMAVIATFLPSVLLNSGIRRIGSSRASLVSAIGPVSTIFLAYIFLGESITAMQLAGTGLVLVGVLAISLKAENKV